MNKEPLFAKVDFEPSNQHGWSNLRGYGLMTTSKYQDGKVLNDRHMVNRLQPLNQPFGQHNPAEGKELQLNSQTDLAWSTRN